MVSVIVPVYNSEKYLRESIESLLAQTYKDIEIICINDGSTDKSLSVLQHYAEIDPRIIVIDKNNAGAGAARNTGMEHVNGEYMCFFDSDDLLEPDAIEQLVRAAESANADAVIYKMDQLDDRTGELTPNTWAIDQNHIPANEAFYAADVDNFYKYVVGFTVNKLYRTAFLLGLNLRFPLIGAHEDMPFTYIALSASRKTYFLDKTLYHYRRAREGSLSDTTSRRYTFMLEALEYMKDGLVEQSLWEDYREHYFNYVVHMCIWKHGELGRFSRIEFRDSCRKVWFRRLGLFGLEDDFFSSPDYRDFVKAITNMPYSRRVVAAFYRLKLAACSF